MKPLIKIAALFVVCNEIGRNADNAESDDIVGSAR